MNFLIYYGIGLTFVTGMGLFTDIITSYFDDMGIKSWGRLEWTSVIIAILLLALIWPILMVKYIVRILYYIIKK